MATTSAAQIYGQIGAAKAFSSSVSYSLGLDIKRNEGKIADLESQFNGGENDKKTAKRIKRLKRQNQFQTASRQVSNSTTQFLTKLASYLDIPIQTIIEFIAYTITGVLPLLEESVKMLLLTNIKRMVSCAVDPTIPDEWRKHGVLLNETEIDPRNILKASPFSKWGKYCFFGCYDTEKDENGKERQVPKDVYELARAEDMNAFLWFTKNKGKFVTANVVSPCDEFFDCDTGTTLYNTDVFKEKEGHKYLPGSVFKQSQNANTIFLCEKKEEVDDTNEYTILPVSESWVGVNWYSSAYNSANKNKTERKYSSEEGLFNIEYVNATDATSLTPRYRDGNFKFRILPQPFTTGGGFVMDLYNNMNTLSDMAGISSATELIGSELSELANNYKYKFTGIQSPIPYTARFNGDGVYDKKGKYSIDTLKYNVVEEDNSTTANTITYSIFRYGSTDDSEIVGKLTFDKKTKKFEITPSGHDISEILTECYFGKTVYEFNFDYVMGMRLFDARSIAIGIVDALMNFQFPVKNTDNNNEDDNSLSDVDQIKINTYVNNLVEKMIQSEDTEEFTDCFYNFSNTDYEKMEQDVANKVARNISFNNGEDSEINAVYDIINAYNADATLEEREETITLALTKAAQVCGFTNDSTIGSSQSIINNTAGALSEERDLTGDFIKKAVSYLITSIVQSILTPKVIMLIQVNRQMMGSDAFSLTERKSSLTKLANNDIEEVLNAISGILKSIIRQVIDTVQKELLRVILERLSEVMTGYIRKLGTEYAMKWVLLLKELLKCFKRDKSKIRDNNYDRLGNTQYTDAINNILDQVDYADIDTLVDELIPNTNPC